MTVVRHSWDRICANPGCDTRLCHLNDGTECFLHARPVFLPSRDVQEDAARSEFDRLIREYPTPQAERMAA